MQVYNGLGVELPGAFAEDRATQPGPGEYGAPDSALQVRPCQLGMAACSGSAACKCMTATCGRCLFMACTRCTAHHSALRPLVAEQACTWPVMARSTCAAPHSASRSGNARETASHMQCAHPGMFLGLLAFSSIHSLMLVEDQMRSNDVAVLRWDVEAHAKGPRLLLSTGASGLGASANGAGDEHMVFSRMPKALQLGTAWHGLEAACHTSLCVRMAAQTAPGWTACAPA